METKAVKWLHFLIKLITWYANLGETPLKEIIKDILL